MKSIIRVLTHATKDADAASRLSAQVDPAKRYAAHVRDVVAGDQDPTKDGEKDD